MQVIERPVFPASWRIRTARLQAETFSSRIWDVERDDASRAVVKDLKPFDDAADELRGAHYLQWRAGVGAVRLLGIDGHRMLLEHAGERMLAQELAERGDVYATEVIAEVLKEILSICDKPIPSELQPLKDRFSSLFDRAAADRSSDARNLYVEAAQTAERLLADPHELRVLHGDFHHDNILHGPRGWLVIDPKGVYGDPAFEAANVFYNPLDRDDLCVDPARIARLAETFSGVLGQSSRRLLDYAMAYGCLSAAWHAGDANQHDENRELGIAAAIREVRGQF